MSTTANPDDPRLGHGTDSTPTPPNAVYLVLSETERARGFVRPVLRSYRHVGAPGPRWPLRALTGEESECYASWGYAGFEPYPADDYPATGRFWTQNRLDRAGKGCRTVTTMSADIAETYAREPGFYGATYCCGCRMHLPVGVHGEFTWMTQDGRDTDERVGT